MYDFLSLGRARRSLIANLGHINSYNAEKLKRSVETFYGPLVEYKFSNVYSYFNSSEFHKSKRGIVRRLSYKAGLLLNRLSPSLAAKIFHDFLVILAKSKDGRRESCER